MRHPAILEVQPGRLGGARGIKKIRTALERGRNLTEFE
jgi:hypothetical protein